MVACRRHRALGDDHSGDLLTPFVVRQTEDRDVGDSGMLAQHILDLTWRDVLTAPYDHIVQTV